MPVLLIVEIQSLHLRQVLTLYFSPHLSDLTEFLSDQSMRYGAVRLAVPPGFQNIIRLISHEVLREQPQDNVKFIADFLQDVLTIRDSE